MALRPTVIREFARYRALGASEPSFDPVNSFSQAELTAAEIEGERLVEIAVRDALRGGSPLFDLLPTTGLETTACQRLQERREEGKQKKGLGEDDRGSGTGARAEQGRAPFSLIPA